MEWLQPWSMMSTLTAEERMLADTRQLPHQLYHTEFVPHPLYLNEHPYNSFGLLHTQMQQCLPAEIVAKHSLVKHSIFYYYHQALHAKRNFYICFNIWWNQMPVEVQNKLTEHMGQRMEKLFYNVYLHMSVFAEHEAKVYLQHAGQSQLNFAPELLQDVFQSYVDRYLPFNGGCLSHQSRQAIQSAQPEQVPCSSLQPKPSATASAYLSS